MTEPLEPPPAPWREKLGARGASVRVGERKYGGEVWVWYFDRTLGRDGGTRKRSLGFRVRNARGKLAEDRVKRARNEARKLSEQRGSATEPVRAVATVEMAARAYRATVLPTHAPRWGEEEERMLRLWERVLGARFHLMDLTGARWAAFTTERKAGRLTCDGSRSLHPSPVSERTVGKELKFLRQLCRFAVREGMLERDPTAFLELPRLREQRRPVFDTDRQARLEEVAPRVTMRDASGRPTHSYLPTLLAIAFGTGRRINALLNLRWDDWRPEEEACGRLRWRAEHDKTRREWWSPVTESVRAALALHEARRIPGSPWLFPRPGDPSRPIHYQTAFRWLRRAEALAELPHLEGGGFHAGRRGWATARKHLPVPDVAAAGGWTTDSTPLRCYMTSDPDTVRRVMTDARPFSLSQG